MARLVRRLLAVLIAGLALSVHTDARQAQERTLPAVLVDAPPVIDGRLDEQAWRRALPADRFRVPERNRAARAATEVRVLADSTAVYFGFVCQDGRSAGLWPAEDRFIVEIDSFQDRERLLYVGVTRSGHRIEHVTGPSLPDGAWTVAVQDGRSGWTGELAVPFARLGVTPTPGRSIRVNFVRYDHRATEWSRWIDDTSGGPSGGLLTNLAAPEPAPPLPPRSGARQPSVQVVGAEYVLQAGDVLQIRHFGYPELNVTLPVRPDGRIALELIGEVDVAGRTAAGLQQVLTERYGRFLRRPDITVIVNDFAGSRVYVAGEVNAPGVIALRGPLTALRAILEAGGARTSGKLKNVVIIRDQGTTQPLFLTANLENALRPSRGALRDVALAPNDIVFVPKTTITKVDEFVRQYITDLMPIPISLGLGYVLAVRP